MELRVREPTTLTGLLVVVTALAFVCTAAHAEGPARQASAHTVSATGIPVPCLPAASAAWNTPTPRSKMSDYQLVSAGSDTVMEKIRGQAALDHLKKVMAKNPNAFGRASKVLRQHGYKPTGVVYVERSIRLASATPPGAGHPSAVAASYTESSSDGEIIIWSWDDGDDATWKGEIYFQNYDTGAAGTWDGEIDDSTTSYPWVWVKNTWQGIGGITKQVGFGVAPSAVRAPGITTAQFPLTANSPHGLNLLTTDWLGWAYCWRRTVITGCIASAIPCLDTGPAFFGCWGARCVGSEIGGAVLCYMEN